MGKYIHPGNTLFREILQNEYVDKTGLIDVVNRVVSTPKHLVCSSRPRRFGKSYAARMLAAYYDKTCNSETLFAGLEISTKPSYRKYLNQFNVVYLDMTDFINKECREQTLIQLIHQEIIAELRIAFPNIISEKTTHLPDALFDIFAQTGETFFLIIDEWDMLFREYKHEEALQKNYVFFLRQLFKSATMARVIKGGYITGILPIKHYGTQSALTDSWEYTMVHPGHTAPYIGFTETEVRKLCEKHSMDFEEMKQWYDGYSFSEVPSVYSPNSVMAAIYSGEYGNYWTRTETYESLRQYIEMNLDGLRDDMISMLGGNRTHVNAENFANDMISFQNKENVLALLVHLGYLAYDYDNQQAYIPNLEVTAAFQNAVKDTQWEGVSKAITRSVQLLENTICGNADAVAEMLEEIHESSSSVLQYNNEASLSAAVSIAYYAAQNYYDIIREFPAGKGFADLTFLPYKKTNKPAMIVELKYNLSADAAINQIKENRYAGALQNHHGEVLLVGISYSKRRKKRKHICKIERVQF